VQLVELVEEGAQLGSWLWGRDVCVRLSGRRLPHLSGLASLLCAVLTPVAVLWLRVLQQRGSCAAQRRCVLGVMMALCASFSAGCAWVMQLGV
jgi:hypothetical protein